MKELVLISAMFVLAGCGTDVPPPLPVSYQPTQAMIDESKKEIQEAKAERRRLHPAEAAAAEAADAIEVARILAFNHPKSTQTAQPVNNEYGYPAVCDTMHFSLLNLYSSPTTTQWYGMYSVLDGKVRLSLECSRMGTIQS
jgi:hypothetical protein